MTKQRRIIILLSYLVLVFIITIFLISQWIPSTSFFGAVLEETGRTPAAVSKGKTVLFTGDIMLARNVERLMGQNGSDYPFRKIELFLRGIDLVVGNLEGPIVYEPRVFPRESLLFNFSSQTGEVLARAHFNLLSLANNHTLNRQEPGLAQTREILKTNGISSVGHPLTCTDESWLEKEGLIFLAFNTTFPGNCSDDNISAKTASVRKRFPEDILIVLMHWGNEYQTVASSKQQKLAHALIDAGADVVIGHHPHVVQNIEIYKEKPVFYSLGNFVFDQYSTTDTEDGLTVGMELLPGVIRYRLFPIDGRNSQPMLMSPEQKSRFLEKIASISQDVLYGDITDGKLEIKRRI